VLVATLAMMTIVENNASAIGILQRGDLVGADEMIHDALRLCLELKQRNEVLVHPDELRRDQDTCLTLASSTWCSVSPPEYSRIHISSQVLIHDTTMVSNSLKTCPHVPFNIYNRALLLGSILLCVPRQSRVDIATAILLYNAGLFYHVVALERGDSTLICQAERYYEMAYSIMSRPDITLLFYQYLPSSVRTDLTTLMLALCNNLAHVKWYRGLYPERDAYISLLSTFLDLTFVADMEEEFLFFYLHCTTYKYLTKVAPAA
jgi:hypothetical protein